MCPKACLGRDDEWAKFHSCFMWMWGGILSLTSLDGSQALPHPYPRALGMSLALRPEQFVLFSN